jgi:LPXTG-motif cell wall-anchored protein
MKRLLPALTALMLVGLVAVPASAQDLTCDDIEFAADLVADYPDVGDACLEIIEKGGERFARLHAQVWREGNKTMTVLYELRDGGWSSPRKVTPPEEWRASVSGQQLRVNELEKGQELNVYIREGRWEIAMADLEATEVPTEFAALNHEVVEEEEAVEEAPAVEELAVVEETPATQAPAEDSGSLLYILGATVLVVLIWLLIRRKKKSQA